jgi:hypothetical protein
VSVIPAHILESVKFPLAKSLIIWHGGPKPLDTISVFEAWETACGVFFLQHIVIVCLHAVLLDPKLDIFVLFAHRKQLVLIGFQVRVNDTMIFPFPWLRNEHNQWSAGTRV